MAASLTEIVIDCSDPELVVNFWPKTLKDGIHIDLCCLLRRGVD